MMKRTLLAALAVAVVGLFGANRADAQEYPDYRLDLGVFGGGSWYSDMLDEDHLGAGVDGAHFEAGWVTGAQIGYWFTPRFGFRAHGAYSERPITGGQESVRGTDDNLVDDVNMWSMSGDLMIRLVPTGGKFTPYLALGAGAKNTNIPGEQLIPGTDGNLGSPFWASESLYVYDSEDEFQLMGLAGIGTDVRLADNFALRLEVGDRFWDEPLYDRTNGVPADPDEDIGKVVHEIYGQLGMHLLLGLSEPEVVAVAPAPPPPAPEPEPEPEPVEESIRVCVIDPAAPGGIQMVDAIYLPETQDTMVVVSGQRRALATTLPRVMLANEADWFVRGEPLAMEVAPDYTLEYTTWQSARMIEADDLMYLGDVRGLPVYASSDDVMDIREELEDLRDARGDNDLAEILEENAELRGEVEDIEYLYVPLRPTGCVFQTVQKVEQVRKK